MDEDVCVSPHAHTHPEFYLDTAKNKVLPSVTTWIDPEDITLSEICQAKKDKYCTFSLIREIKKKNKSF